jgi:hypothetical protein
VIDATLVEIVGNHLRFASARGWGRCRFSILEGKSLSGASFTSVKQLKERIDAFIEAYNRNPTPFAWTKAVVHQRRFKDRRISQL